MSLTDDLNDFKAIVNGFDRDPELLSIIKRIDAAVKVKDYTQAFLMVEDGNALLSSKLVDEAAVIMESAAFKVLTPKAKAAVIRHSLAGGLVKGYSVSARLTDRITSHMNTAVGVTAVAQKVQLPADTLKGVVAETIKFALDEEAGDAASFWRGSGDTVVKKGGIQAQLLAADTAKRKYKTMFARKAGGAKPCKYCSGLAGFWTPDPSELKRFHSRCRCVLISKRVPI